MSTSAGGGRAESSTRRRIIVVLGAFVVLALLAFGAFAWWFLDDDAPDSVTIENAAAQVSAESSDVDGSSDATVTTEATASAQTATTVAATPADTEPSGAGSLDGVWNVDTSIGEFSYEDSTGTFVGFRIAEELRGIGSTDAVGRTPAVTGSLVVDGTTITDVSIEADMTAITTDDSRRDDAVHDALDTDTIPTATFVLTEPIELDDSALDGAPIVADAVGDLTVHGVTASVTIPLDAQLVDDTIVVVGSLEIVFAEYGVELPSAPIVLSVDDRGPIELQLFFTR
ncbi:MAG: YceI family protein [Actinomycetota bacterium]